MMQDELNTFIPDTTAMLEKLLAEKERKKCSDVISSTTRTLRSSPT